VGCNIDGHKVLGTIADLGTVLRDHALDEVIVAVPRRRIDEELEEPVRVSEAEGVKATLMADLAAPTALSTLGRAKLAVTIFVFVVGALGYPGHSVTNYSSVDYEYVVPHAAVVTHTCDNTRDVPRDRRKVDRA
jgi:hypothetical protein